MIKYAKYTEYITNKDLSNTHDFNKCILSRVNSAKFGSANPIKFEQERNLIAHQTVYCDVQGCKD